MKKSRVWSLFLRNFFFNHIEVIGLIESTDWRRLGQVKKNPSNGHEYKVGKALHKKDRQEKEKTDGIFLSKMILLRITYLTTETLQ